VQWLLAARNANIAIATTVLLIRRFDAVSDKRNAIRARNYMQLAI
jgi:hypothetical protein